MDAVAILEKIIKEDGSCSWANPSICRNCAFGNLESPDSGKKISCVEALNVDGLSEADADAKYKSAAIDKLASLLIEKAIIEEKDGIK